MPWIQTIQVDSDPFRYIKKIPCESIPSDAKYTTAD